MREMQQAEVDDIEPRALLWSLGEGSNHMKTTRYEEQATTYKNTKAERIRSRLGLGQKSVDQIRREQILEMEVEEMEATSNWQRAAPQRMADRIRWQTNSRAIANVRERLVHEQAIFAEQEERERFMAERSAQIAEEARIGREALLRATGPGMVTENSKSMVPPLNWNLNQRALPTSQSLTTASTVLHGQRLRRDTNETAPSFGPPTNAERGSGVYNVSHERWLPLAAQPSPLGEPSMQFASSRANAGPAHKPSVVSDPARTTSRSAGKSSTFLGSSPSPIPEESPRPPRIRSAWFTVSSTTTANATSNPQHIRPEPVSKTGTYSSTSGVGARAPFSTVNDQDLAQKRREYHRKQQQLAEEQKRRENEHNERRAEEARRRGEERRRQEELAREARCREAERKAYAASGQLNLAQTTEVPIMAIWNVYEQQWRAMPDASHLRFHSIPWPIMAQIDNPEQLIPVQIAHFILTPQHSVGKPRKDRLKEALLRWHPDRFETKWLNKVVEEDREAVKDGVGRVVRALNDLLNADELFG